MNYSIASLIIRHKSPELQHHLMNLQLIFHRSAFYWIKYRLSWEKHSKKLLCCLNKHFVFISFLWILSAINCTAFEVEQPIAQFFNGCTFATESLKSFLNLSKLQENLFAINKTIIISFNYYLQKRFKQFVFTGFFCLSTLRSLLHNDLTCKVNKNTVKWS